MPSDEKRFSVEVVGDEVVIRLKIDKTLPYDRKTGRLVYATTGGNRLVDHLVHGQRLRINCVGWVLWNGPLPPAS